ncbi:hypothetical protein CXG81DRAFT_28885 [Caulochytrium protostelioides]|uniref:MAPEG family protein n=1 Tax=Caulochytrium protostelioides TaxID=1555241 RepID=A0A4P9X0S3_9FUNG|nr:hypothetical protein CXG81DRAFT_28885 [Caulochytrium protostelioides]|eukprot:RKO98278.1 hypothetical protein CXG81DRAFT_28885 [Caulochytrium protostelioides]
MMAFLEQRLFAPNYLATTATGIFALTLFSQALAVSRERARTGARGFAPALDEKGTTTPLFRLQRAHGNTAEYAPTILLLLFGLERRLAGPGVPDALRHIAKPIMVTLVVSRLATSLIHSLAAVAPQARVGPYLKASVLTMYATGFASALMAIYLG